MKLHLMHFQPSSTVLGPYLRSIIWVQGCLKNCPGCIAQESHEIKNDDGVEVATILNWINEYPDNEGITISGGEPFLQAKALVMLVREVKKQAKGVIIYSGYTYNELVNKHDQDIDDLLNLTDLLIDGPFIEQLDNNEAGRGSTNQNIIFLTSRYQKDKAYFYQERQANIYIDGNKYIMEGIPSEEDKILYEAIIGDMNNGNK